MVKTGLFCGIVLIGMSGCAVLHHAQVGDVDDSPDYTRRSFDIKFSETGIDVEEAGHVAKAVSRSGKGNKAIDDAVAIIGMFQMGPRTGNLIFNEKYAENLLYRIQEECPSGRVSGLMAIRETRKYPVISGEIVKITGYCLTPKKKA